MVVAAHADMALEGALQHWMQVQIRMASGERKRKLKEGLSYAEDLFLRNVWWIAFGNFNHLHPQFEIRDFKDGVRFLDFAYIKNGIRLCIEIDPYGTHARNLTRWEHDDHLDRQNDLVLDEWKLLRFSLDQLKEKPRKCQQKLQHGLGKWGAVRDSSLPANPIDQAIVNLMLKHGVPLSPIEISRELAWGRSTISKHLVALTVNKHLLPAGSSKQRVTKYMVNTARYKVVTG